MNKRIKNIQFKLSKLLPTTCLVCGAPGMEQWDLCDPCYQSLPDNEAACSMCGIPLPDASANELICGHCLLHPPPYHHCIAGWRYEPPMDYFVLGLKFNKDLTFARLMASLLAHRLLKHFNNQKHKPEVILPVPLHAKRLRQRGFNQAAEIAKILSRKLHLPLDMKACSRPKMTLPQAELPADERKRNMSKAFVYQPASPYSRVAIVDDVMTTGHTVNELAKTIQKHHKTIIDVWVCARANYR
jgi:ComF family protein